MAFTGYGALKGAASRINYQGLIDSMVQQEQLTQATIDRKKAEVEYHAEKQKRGHTGIGYLDNQLDEMNKGLVSELGTFVNENPDWQMSVEKTAAYNSITDGFLNNQWMKDGQIAQANYDAYTAATQNGELTKNEIIEYGNAWEEYNKPGTPGEYKTPFQFSTPKRFSVDQISKASSSMIVPVPKMVTSGGMSYRTFTVPQAEIDRVTGLMLSDPTYTSSIDSMWQGTSEMEGKAGMYPSKYAMVEDIVRSSGAKMNAMTGGRAYKNDTKNSDAMTQDDIDTFMTNNYWLMLREQMKNNESVNSVPNIAALTDLKEEGFAFKLNDSNLPMSQFFQSTPDGDGYRQISLPYDAEVTSSAGRVFMRGGTMFAELPVEVRAPGDKKQELADYGFSPQFTEKEATQGTFQGGAGTYNLNTGSAAGYTDLEKYTGTVTVPVYGNDPLKQREFALGNNKTPTYVQKYGALYSAIAGVEPVPATRPGTAPPVENWAPNTVVVDGETKKAYPN